MLASEQIDREGARNKGTGAARSTANKLRQKQEMLLRKEALRC